MAIAVGNGLEIIGVTVAMVLGNPSEVSGLLQSIGVVGESAGGIGRSPHRVVATGFGPRAGGGRARDGERGNRCANSCAIEIFLALQWTVNTARRVRLKRIANLPRRAVEHRIDTGLNKRAPVWIGITWLIAVKGVARSVAEINDACQ